MRILVIGGTRFVGRHFVEQALAAGHRLTLFNRGESAPDLFPDVETLVGDRESDLDAATKERGWDVVLDTCGFHPDSLERSCCALSGRVGRYLLISTISVYADHAVPGIGEDYPTATLPAPVPFGAPITAETYGPLKAACEGVVRRHFPTAHMIVRPGLIVGPDDRYTRFSQWVARARRGGRMPVVGRPDRLVQFIDVRDLAAFLLHLCAMDWTGTVQVTGPTAPMTLGDLVGAWTEGTVAEPVWVPTGPARTAAGGELPVPYAIWADPEPSAAHLLAVDIARAVGLGLTCQPVAETVRDTAAWLDARGDAAGADRLDALEAKLLAAAG